MRLDQKTIVAIEVAIAHHVNPDLVEIIKKAVVEAIDTQPAYNDKHVDDDELRMDCD